MGLGISLRTYPQTAYNFGFIIDGCPNHSGAMGRVEKVVALTVNKLQAELKRLGHVGGLRFGSGGYNGIRRGDGVYGADYRFVG